MAAGGSSRRREALAIPRRGLVWTVEVQLYRMTGKWSERFKRDFLRVGKNDEKALPPGLEDECKAARAAWVRGERPEGWTDAEREAEGLR